MLSLGVDLLLLRDVLLGVFCCVLRCEVDLLLLRDVLFLEGLELGLELGVDFGLGLGLLRVGV